MWQTDYRGRVIIEPDTINNGDTYDSDGEKDVFRFFNHASSQTLTNPDTSDLSDEYLKYISKELVEESVPNPLDWWRRHQQFYPNLSRMAFDLFAVPAMSSECEQAFSKASYTIAARRSNLSGDIVEAGEYLRSWISAGIVQIKTPETS